MSKFKKITIFAITFFIINFIVLFLIVHVADPLIKDNIYSEFDFSICDVHSKNIFKENDDELIVSDMEFEHSTVFCIIKNLKNKKKLTINKSLGGLSSYAYYLTRYLNEYDIKFKNGSVCISACAEVLIKANYSSMCKHSIIGIHQGSSKTRMNFFDNILNFYFTLNYLYYDVDFIHVAEKTFNTPFDDISLIFSDDALKYKYIKEIEKCY